MPRGRPRKNPDDALIRSAEFIGWALGGLEREIIETRNKLTSLTAQAASLRKKIAARGATSPASSAPSEVPAEGGRKRKRRKMSPEARKRISEMMKKRWAERRKK